MGNGKFAGEHNGGYASFSLDISRFVIFGEENIIAVAVNNTRNDEYGTPPMSAGNFNVYGGIYRDVRLVIKNKMYIPFQGSADYEGGTFVTTPLVGSSVATVRVQTWVRNEGNVAQLCTLKTAIAGADNKIIATICSVKSIRPDETARFDQLSDTIRNPKLWSPDAPNVYKVYSEVILDNVIADQYLSPLGFRWFLVEQG
ncbi:MAG: hypothetical protein HC905_04130 [Bacteroidales bacterium]|nr:hypothetical protein [Bacteroidales bacterium]